MRIFYPKARGIRAESKPPPAFAGSGFTLFCFFSGFSNYRDHVFEQDLKRHGMTATQVRQEKLAVTLEDAMIETNFVGIVIAIKGELKPLELETVSFFSIAFGFLNLADHPIVHDFVSFL